MGWLGWDGVMAGWLCSVVGGLWGWLGMVSLYAGRAVSRFRKLPRCSVSFLLFLSPPPTSPSPSAPGLEIGWKEGE